MKTFFVKFRYHRPNFATIDHNCQVKSSVGARASEALRCVHLPLPHLGRSSGIRLGSRPARYTNVLEILLQLLQPPFAWSPYWAPPPPWLTSTQNSVRWVGGRKTHYVAVVSQLSEPDLAGDATHLRQLQYPLVRHFVFPTDPEYFAEGVAHESAQSSLQPPSQRPCFT